MQDSVLVSEVSLRRNYQDLRFCPQDDQEDLEESRRRSLNKLQAIYSDSITLDAQSMGRQGIPYLQEVLLPANFRRLAQAALLSDESLAVSAAINMDEHLVVKAQGKPGEIPELIQTVREMEEGFTENKRPFAYDSKYGYLSYRPVLAGSGLHINLVLFLPMLHFLKQIPALSETLKEQGCILKPLSLLDGRNPARLYALSNASSLMMEDRQIQSNVVQSAQMVVTREQSLQDKAMSKSSQSSILDQIWRSYGILKYARRLSITDFLTHWSNLRMGIQGGILPLSLSQADEMLAFANDHVFLKEGAEPNTFVFRRAEKVRRALSGG